MKKFIVIGNPIKHSLSPLVHNHWFEKNKVEASYEKKQLEDSDLKNIAQEIREEKISGINITVPFKQKIIPFLDELSQIAQATNSVNTVYKKDNKRYLYFTIDDKTFNRDHYRNNKATFANIINSAHLFCSFPNLQFLVASIQSYSMFHEQTGSIWLLFKLL